MIPDHLTPAQEAALDDLFHQCDLINASPLPCEIEWALNREAQNAIAQA